MSIDLSEGVPNLDDESTADLMDFWFRIASHPVRVGRKLFPDRPEGYVGVTQALASYAASRSAAKTCREEGKIEQALSYENACDILYEDLPEWARW